MQELLFRSLFAKIWRRTKNLVAASRSKTYPVDTKRKTINLKLVNLIKLEL